MLYHILVVVLSFRSHREIFLVQIFFPVKACVTHMKAVFEQQKLKTWFDATLA